MAHISAEFKPIDELSDDYVASIVATQIRLMDQLEVACTSQDTPRIVALARELVGLEKQVTQV